MITNRYDPGDIVIVREFWNGKLFSARPQRVVEDTADMIALFMVEGTRFIDPTNQQGGRVAPKDMKEERWLLKERTWKGPGALRLNIPGSIFSVWIFWENNYSDISSWYINLEETLHRTPSGFENKDLVLDVWLPGNLSEIHWKDEDEFESLERLGLISHTKASKLRAEGDRVAAMLQTGTSPFNRWRNWVPDPGWPGISLPGGWEKII